MTDPTANNTIVPLNSRTQIVNADGTPTLFFQRWAQERSIDISGGITYDQLVEILTIVPDPTGSYTTANITVNEYGQIVAAENGTSGAPLEVTDGTTTESDVTTLTFAGAVVSTTGTGEATVTIDQVTEGGIPVNSIIAGTGISLTNTVGVLTIAINSGDDPVLIKSYTAAGGETYFDFLSIPGTFTDLELTFLGQLTATDAVGIYFNGDYTDSHYSGYSFNHYGNGINVNLASLASCSGVAGYSCSGNQRIPAYTANHNKQGNGLYNFWSNTDIFNAFQSLVWETGGTASITSIRVYARSGAFEAGSVVSLFAY